MPPIESINGASASRLALSSLPAPAPRSGADKAQAVQSAATSQAAAPIQSTNAVLQAQAQEATRLNPAPVPVPVPPSAASLSVPRTSVQTLSQPMTAVLLHELRLQQELADVRDKLGSETSPGVVD